MNGRPCYSRFSLYAELWQSGLRLHELYALMDNGALLFARAEDSGCEGAYVEIARWCDERNQWFRFAFEKYLGGEDGCESTDWQLAEWAAAKINAYARCRDVAWVHSLPNWTEA